MTKNSGFGILEVVIVLAIVAVLTTIAIPVYRSHGMKSRRMDAISVLLNLSNTQEQYRATNTNYANSLKLLGYTTGVISTENNYYTITVTDASADSFSITATPVIDGVQADDSCGSFIMTQRWPDDLTAEQLRCWNYR